MHRRRRRIKPRPIVDVVLPTYGQPEFLRACLESLYAHDAGVEYTVTVQDDQSPDPDEMGWVYDWAADHGAEVAVNHENKGFAGTCNAGARSGKAPWILLLNTDTVVIHDGWLKNMVEQGKDRRVGVVGCLLTFFPEHHPLYDPSPLRPPGKTQHAGVAFDIMGRPYHIFSGWDPSHPKVAQRREMNCVTGACFLVRRKLWLRLGGLAECYGPGNFEDVEFCLRARLAGYKVVYAPDTHLRHFAGGSNNSETAQRNAQLFQLRMGQLVEYDEWRFW